MANHNEVAHAWAHQTGKQRKGFNMFYEGRTIYSYGHHFPIACILETGVVLFTSKSYSMSTSKHKTYTARAIGHLVTFTVPNVKATTPREHLENYKAYITTAKDDLDKAKRARKYKDYLINSAQHAVKEANDYAYTFALDVPALSLEALDANAAELVRVANEQRELDARAYQREERARNKPMVREWLLGANDGRYVRTPRPLCRVNGDKVETTWGASVPLDIAITAFRMATRVRKAGIEWRPNGLNGLKVGDFALTSIGPTGNLIIGCHNIPYRFAKLAAYLAGITI